MIVTVVKRLGALPKDRKTAQQLFGPALQPLSELWLKHAPDLKPAEWHLLVYEDGGYAPAKSGPVQRLDNPFQRGELGPVAVAFSMTDESSAKSSPHYVWSITGVEWSDD